MTQCAKCGTANKPSARFCYHCGTPLSLLLPLGTIVQGRYKVSSVLGQGGMGAVYLVEDQKVFGKRLALKELLDTFTNPAERAQAIQQFEQEAQMLVSLSHPNLPQISDYFSERGRQYLVMECIEGETLEDILANTSGFLPEAQVVDWVVQICDVLEYLHSRQPPVIFRDLKPDNMMLGKGDRIKLIDFGIARLFRPGKSKDTQIMGSPGYAAPEQYGTGQTDARSDIYSLGATMHELLTKRDPSTQPHVFPPCKALNNAVSDLAAGVISKATNLDPGKRYQSATEMKHAMLGSLSGSPQSSQPALPSGIAGPQPVQWIQGFPKRMFLAYCQHDKRETTWMVDTHPEYTSLMNCTCLECDCVVYLGACTLTIEAVLEAFCSQCKTRTHWLVLSQGRVCLGCGQRR